MYRVLLQVPQNLPWDHSTDVLRGMALGKWSRYGVGASSSITYNYINPLRLCRFSLVASMAYGETERTNTELFFCINLAEGRRNASADPLNKSSIN